MFPRLNILSLWDSVSVCLSLYLSVSVSLYLSVSICLLVSCLSLCLSLSLSVLFTCTLFYTSQLMYTGSLIGFTVYSQNQNSSLVLATGNNHNTSIKHERLLAIFCMVSRNVDTLEGTLWTTCRLSILLFTKPFSSNYCHVFIIQFHSLLWVMVAGMDRIVQWRHRVMRRKGYLKFYRRMRNIRRVPFVMISTGILVWCDWGWEDDSFITSVITMYASCMVVIEHCDWIAHQYYRLRDILQFKN